VRTRAILAVAVLIATASCNEEPLPTPPKPNEQEIVQAHADQRPDDSAERLNLFNFARGASVVSRTGEVSLANSALRAIDGDPSSSWISPPADPEQTLTFALAAPSRVHQIGAASNAKLQFAARTLRFESSLDGKSWRPLTTVTLEPKYGEQLFDVKPPVDMLYLRVMTSEGYAGGTNATIELRGVHARGEELAPPAPRQISGCWSINGFPAQFTEQGGAAFGFLDNGQQTWLDGGFDGRVWRFVWIRGPQFGVAAVTMPSDGARLSGLPWFEDVDNYKAGDSWFGERAARCPSMPKVSASVLHTFLERHHFVPLYGLHFDDQGALQAKQSEAALYELNGLVAGTAPRPLRIVSREFRGANEPADLKTSQVRLDSLRAELQRRGVDLSRVTFAALGRGEPHAVPWSEIMRVMQSGIEVEIPVSR
jgi:hypothetical protein